MENAREIVEIIVEIGEAKKFVVQLPELSKVIKYDLQGTIEDPVLYIWAVAVADNEIENLIHYVFSDGDNPGMGRHCGSWMLLSEDEESYKTFHIFHHYEFEF